MIGNETQLIAKNRAIELLLGKVSNLIHIVFEILIELIAICFGRYSMPALVFS